jgi:hypothetical protein
MNIYDIVLKQLQEGVNYFTAMELLKEEAATVAREDNYQFMIFPEPLGNPSFHVQYKDEWEVVLEIMTFKILEVKYGKFKKGTILPKKIMKDILKILNSKDDLNILVWYYMRQTWNLNNPNYKIQVKQDIPIL